MPAAIRIDVQVTSFRDSDQTVDDSKGKLKVIAERIGEEVRRILKDETTTELDIKEGTPTTDEMVKVRIQEGLGPSWPPEPESSDPKNVGDMMKEYLDNPNPSTGLGREERYDDGTFHVKVNLDLG